jgi:hypothetical protein
MGYQGYPGDGGAKHGRRFRLVLNVTFLIVVLAGRLSSGLPGLLSRESAAERSSDRY